ncbi:hypothetical protein V6N11_052944 [Hibiscus sabdariffa]|uniref:Subtilisin-like protease fibronectin type-III domain-containing protein n=1 Tax=Hibiscus sabdariffa TaxID=183260 RepID=A0ABR2UBM1_9ROSI
MDHSAMPKAFASRQSWYMSTLSSLSANTNAKIPAAKPIYSYNHVIQVDRTLGASLRLGTDVFVNGEVLYPGNFSSSQFPIVFMDACDDIDELKKVAANIVVCQDPGSEASLSDQFFNILAAGNAAGVFITNYTHLDISIQSSFPAIFLGQKDGDVVLGYIKTNKTPKASIEFKRTFLGFKPSPIEKNEKQSFKLRIEAPPQLNETVSFGYLAWEDSQGKHVVRSPIVATTYSIVK